MNNFSTRLAGIMEEKHLTQSDLAELLRTSQSTVSRWVDGTIPRPRTLEDLAKALGTSPEWLKNGTGEAVLNTPPRRSVGYADAPEPGGETRMKETSTNTGTVDLELFARLLQRIDPDILLDVAAAADEDPPLHDFSSAVIRELVRRKSRPNIHLNRKP